MSCSAVADLVDDTWSKTICKKLILESCFYFLFSQVEIGRDIQARVQVLDVTGHKLFASFFPLMGLTLHAASDIITVK
ncbi:hypothetical protein DPMN_008113 [Dreissena polymorpha]|uniref:Uncharacterized protein n=1 Tax=Dreissena polymorpha TaxID=45954 RepID=A0A9D4MY66_DREPO|nr:hypothetical protein DPMN_008113 [Dreissena polymorpha]